MGIEEDMGDPRKEYENLLQGALIEIISAQSSLNMQPNPVKKPPKDARYLSELDEWAKHAMEHLRAAFDLVRRAEHEEQIRKDKELRAEIKRLEEKNNAG